MYKTNILLDVEVSTQFGPLDAVDLLRCSLNFPAISKAKVVKITSDYKPLTKEDANLRVFKELPINLK